MKKHLFVVMALSVVAGVGLYALAVDPPAEKRAPTKDSTVAAVEPKGNDANKNIESISVNAEHGDSDSAFNRFVNVGEISEAIAVLNGRALVDATIGLAEAEVLYHRQHLSGLTSDRLFRTTLRTLTETDDKVSLDRLKKYSLDKNKDAWKKQIDGAAEFRGITRGLKPLGEKSTPATKEFHTNFGKMCLAAELLHDVETLQSLKESISLQSGIPDDQLTLMSKAVDASIAACNKKGEDEEFFAKSRQVAPERILEGTVSGAVEAALIQELGGLKSDFSNSWGHQARIWRGQTKVVWKGIDSRTEKIYENVNDGTWSRGWVRIENARDTIDVKFRNFRATPGRPEVRFDIYATCQFRGYVEGRQYKHGVQLWGLDANARARGHIYATIRVYLHENGTRLGWDVEKVDIKYSNVEVDRIGAVGGYAARVLGDAFTGVVDKWFADKKNDAIEKAKTAVSRSFGGSIDIRNAIAQMIRQVAR
jgi:hypothetical protein